MWTALDRFVTNPLLWFVAGIPACCNTILVRIRDSERKPHARFASLFVSLCCLFLLSSTTRNLAEIFMVLPTRKELPDYYQIIKHPVDIRKIRVMFLSSSYMAIDCYSDAFSVISDLNRTCYSQCLRSQLYHWPCKCGVPRKGGRDAFLINRKLFLVQDWRCLPKSGLTFLSWAEF